MTIITLGSSTVLTLTTIKEYTPILLKISFKWFIVILLNQNELKALEIKWTKDFVKVEKVCRWIQISRVV